MFVKIVPRAENVCIRDVNDLPPVFEKNAYARTIYEETVHITRPIIKV